MDADQDDPLGVSDERLLHAVRAASGPAPDEDLARRVADGAWSRATQLRARPGRRLWLRRPAYVAAAAAALLAAVVLWPVDGVESALAVEGDPVLVWKGDDWKPESRVDAGRYVFVPHDGERTLRFRDGSEIDADPGSVFITLRASGPDRKLPFELQVVRGTVRYDGTARPMRVAQIDVDPDPDTLEPGVRISLSGSAGAERPLDLTRLIRLTAACEPRVAVTTGSFTVRARPTGEVINLAPSESAAFVRLTKDDGERRLTRVLAFSPQVLGDVIEHGDVPVDATMNSLGATFVFLGGGGVSDILTAVEISSAERDRAIPQLNAATFFRQQLTSGFDALRASIDIRVGARFTPARESEYVLERGDERFAVYLRADGSCQLDENGRVTEFLVLDALRAAAPHVAEAFGDRLGR